jgi:cell division control protein 6
MFESKASAVIRDGSKLSFEYVPERLIHREEQMSRLEMLFRPLFEHGRSSTAFLTGTVGTGKTATAKRFCADLMKHGAKTGRPVECVIVNCRGRGTEAGVLIQLLRHFDPGFPDRGFSPAEMMRSLRALIERSRVPLVVVLDEADVLIKKNSADLIYRLSRFAEEGVGMQSPVSLMLISPEYVLDRLDEASLSTFRRANTVRFGRYSRDELRSIVEYWAGEALVADGITEGALDLIADISDEFGDARFAIELLDRAASIAEGKTLGRVTAEDVRAAKAMTHSVVTESKLESLDANRRLVLLAVARSIKDSTYVGMGAAEKAYAVVCEEYGVPARKHTQFWTYVQDLDAANLIQTVVRGDREDGGRTTFISLPDIPSKVLAERVESLMESDPPV